MIKVIKFLRSIDGKLYQSEIDHIIMYMQSLRVDMLML